MTETPTRKGLGGKWADPAARQERARKAAQASNGPAGVIRRLRSVADQLTIEQVAEIAAILATRHTHQGTP